MIEIWWGANVYRFQSAAEALAAGFHVTAPEGGKVFRFQAATQSLAEENK